MRAEDVIDLRCGDKGDLGERGLEGDSGGVAAKMACDVEGDSGDGPRLAGAGPFNGLPATASSSNVLITS